MKPKLRTVIIGGSSGIGLSIAQKLYSLGHEVVIASRSKDKLKKAEKVIGKAKSYVLDVTKENEVAQFFETIGPFDHLVTTAADLAVGSFLHMPLEEAKRFFDSKFWGQYLAAKYGAPHIRKKGSITFFSGVGDQKPFKHFSTGCAIDAALVGLTQALALELSPLRVNAISPGPVKTPLWNSLPGGKLISLGLKFKHLLFKSVGNPKDVAQAALYLIQCDYATGSVVYVDGGIRFS